MKKILLIILFTSSFIKAQELKTKIDTSNVTHSWIIGVSFNSVENNGNGSSSIYSNFLALNKQDANNGVPVMVFTEYRVNKTIGIALSGSFNKWNANEGFMDGELILSDFKYFAVDITSKFYINELFLKKSFNLSRNWLELFASTGIGYFKINKGGFSKNFGLGSNVWFHKKVGITLSMTGKWSLEKNPERYDTNHTQFSMGLVYSL